MPVRISTEDNVVTAYLSGEIDHHSAAAIRDAIDTEIQIQRPKVLRLDFSDVSFMDSSGVGLIMGRYKNALNFGGTTEVHNLPPFCERILKLSGLEKIIRFYKENRDASNK
ncbi:MAG: STAS domain-containing protein [Clostridiales bacterium]|jgi:stage II sporulation protein AA (anti-sigma F factor antagonist)|nr:STAS domain-containing protein [Clostridiales bacterium]HOA34589.1 STAS domain-containing protein [Clostridiales bacterium]HOJ35291.1 STAS domain-containing protein [Clostridiales bacterium]HOL79019.1 STAS domain-containing protein [Clostridiales bacterium]HPU66896.1 STAS domain-containing protein [Clostridiales bacterium]